MAWRKKFVFGSACPPLTFFFVHTLIVRESCLSSSFCTDSTFSSLLFFVHFFSPSGVDINNWGESEVQDNCTFPHQSISLRGKVKAQAKWDLGIVCVASSGCSFCSLTALHGETGGKNGYKIHRLPSSSRQFTASLRLYTMSHAFQTHTILSHPFLFPDRALLRKRREKGKKGVRRGEGVNVCSADAPHLLSHSFGCRAGPL